MKKLVLLMMITCMAIPCFGQSPFNIWTRPDADWLTGQTPNFDPAWAWMKWMDSQSIGIVNYGKVYYVDNNSGVDTNNGESWRHAVLTIAKALELSHAEIARSPHYADRNTIFVRGDDFDEDWTDLAQKTDVVGVGSDDGNKGPRILGNHVIDAVATGYNYMGCRFINMTFVNQTAADIFVVPTGHHGLEWIGCRFESNSSTLAPSALDITQCSDTRIVGCEFISSVNPMWASGAIDFGAGLCQNTDILDNFIDAAIGITIDSSATGLSSRIEGNTIHASTLTIDDNSDVFWIANNTLISEADFGVASYDFTDDQAAGNTLRADNGAFAIPRAANDTLDVGTAYYVDSVSGSNAEDGLSWATAFVTIQTAVTAADDFDTIYIRGVFSEAVTTDTDDPDVKIIGVSDGMISPAWLSGATGSSALTLRSLNWQVENIYFQGASNTVPLIDVRRDGSNLATGTVIKNCSFHGVGGSHSAIRLFGGVVQAKILNNRFADFYGVAHPGLGATVFSIPSGGQAAVHCDFIGNTFVDNLDALSIQGVGCIIKDNVFTKTGHVQDTTTVINTVGAGGAGGANIVTGNVFDNMTYEIDNANGYYGNTEDVWAGNICPDGMTIEAVPGAGTANIEQDAITPTVHLTTTVTANFSGAAYETGDSPVTIFTVTGDVLVRAFGVVKTACTSTGTNGTLELGVAGATAVLLVQDAVDGTAFDTGFTWTKTTACSDDNVALLDAEWILLGNGPDIILTIATNSMTAGIVQFGLQWIPMSANANVVGAAP